MSKGKLKEQIYALLKICIPEAGKHPELDAILDEAKKEFPSFENMPHTHNELVNWIIDHDYKTKKWFEKWFVGDEQDE